MKKLLLLCMIALLGVSCNKEDSTLSEEDMLLESLQGYMAEFNDYDVSRVEEILTAVTGWTMVYFTRHSENWEEVERSGFIPGMGISVYRFSEGGALEIITPAPIPGEGFVEYDSPSWEFDATTRELKLWGNPGDRAPYTIKSYILRALGSNILILDSMYAGEEYVHYDRVYLKPE